MVNDLVNDWDPEVIVIVFVPGSSPTVGVQRQLPILSGITSQFPDEFDNLIETEVFWGPVPINSGL